MKTSLKLGKLCVGLASGFAVVSIVVGCSAPRRTVYNRAPDLGEKVLKFDNEFGEIKQPDISIFLWPAELSGDALREAILKVKLASNRVDELKISGIRKNGQIQALMVEFSSDDCVKKYAAETDSIDEDIVTQWKVATNDAEKAPIDKCAQNQAQRQLLQAELEAASKEAGDSTGVIFSTIDPTYPKQVNWKPVLKPKDSTLIIKDGANVVLTIRGFLTAKNDFSSVAKNTKIGGDVDESAAIQDLSYSVERKQLKFVLPSVPETVTNADGSTSVQYARYEMTLERTNFNGQPRFSGDVKYTMNGVSRNGSIKIDGTLVP